MTSPTEQQQADDHAIQILSNEGAQCGDCGDQPGDRVCPNCERCRGWYVAALRKAGWAPQPEHDALLAEVRRLQAELEDAIGVSESLYQRLSQEQLAGSALYAAMTMPTTPQQRQAALDQFTTVAQQVSEPSAAPAV